MNWLSPRLTGNPSGVKEMIIRDRGRSLNNPWFVVRDNESCWLVFSRFVWRTYLYRQILFGWSREWQYQVGTARDGAGRLVEHGGRNAAASSWPAVAGPNVPLVSRGFKINEPRPFETTSLDT